MEFSGKYLFDANLEAMLFSVTSYMYQNKGEMVLKYEL